MNIFKVSEGKLIHIQKERINTGSKNFFKIQIQFDESWDKFTFLRFAELYQNIECTHFKIQIDQSGIIDIPIDLLFYSLPIYLGVSAENKDGTIGANTNFVQLPTIYGADTKKEGVIYPEELNNVFNLFSSDINLRYLRVNNGVLEYSPNNKLWIAISGSGGGSSFIDYEKIKEIVQNEIEDLASKEYVNNTIANLVNSAPETLDTLGELAIAIEENQSIIDLLNKAVAQKADKVLIGDLPQGEDNVMSAIFSAEERAKQYTSDSIQDIVNNLNIATNEIAGLVKSSNDTNFIFVEESGYMRVNSINLDNIIQNKGDSLILKGGISSNSK